MLGPLCNPHASNVNDIEEPRFRTRAEAEAEIAAINEEIEWWQELVKDDIERLEEQRDEIEDELDNLPDEEEEKETDEQVLERFDERQQFNNNSEPFSFL
jgi:predicted  nucleic acid-binding Zn-ribbon protein